MSEHALSTMQLTKRKNTRVYSEYRCVQYIAVVAEVICSTWTAVSVNGEQQKPELNSLISRHFT